MRWARQAWKRAKPTGDPKTDFRGEFPRFQPENLEANMPIVDLLKLYGAKKNATPAQIVLAWLLAKKPFIVSIPGTRSLDHLTENLGAVNVHLTQQDMVDIEAASSQITIHGEIMSGKHYGSVRSLNLIGSEPQDFLLNKCHFFAFRRSTMSL
ncbi:MAG TPA: aldo/keto reductase [Terrimicrobiaceae bacterium]